MEVNTKFLKTPVAKVCVVAVIALFMLIPLAMVRGQVGDRSSQHDASLTSITNGWGVPQTLTGPWLSYSYGKETDGKKETLKASIYPDSLKYEVGFTSQVLHRSIFEVPVYTADISIRGDLVADQRLAEAGTADFFLDLESLKGIQGRPVFTVGGKELKIKSDGEGIRAEMTLDPGIKEGDRIPFIIDMKLNGSESFYIRPVGNLTEVEMTSDYPDPSFDGDFLPVERNISENGFTARWQVSQITLASITSDRFGVRLVKPVTQYRQTERSIKYGLLVIFLIFIAAFAVEMISKKPISLIQYMVVGASLVLFYALLLAFSDFLSFGLSYLIAAVMTSGALGAYFGAIVKSKWAYLLTGLVAAAYAVIYILLQMETFAFLTGTLLLFAILCVVMRLTRGTIETN